MTKKIIGKCYIEYIPLESEIKEARFDVWFDRVMDWFCWSLLVLGVLYFAYRLLV